MFFVLLLGIVTFSYLVLLKIRVSNYKENHFKMHKVISALTVDDIKHYLKVETENGQLSIEIPQNQCFEFDSVEIKYTNFGYKVRVRENFNCLPIKKPEKYTSSNYWYQGVQLTKKRCFTDAIDYYTNGISNDSLNSDWYYSRGLNYMFQNKYESALFDFIEGYSLYDSTQFKSEIIANIFKSKNLIYNNNKQLLKEVEYLFSNSKSLRNLKHFDKIISLSQINDYERLIKLCYNKVKLQQK